MSYLIYDDLDMLFRMGLREQSDLQPPVAHVFRALRLRIARQRHPVRIGLTLRAFLTWESSHDYALELYRWLPDWNIGLLARAAV